MGAHGLPEVCPAHGTGCAAWLPDMQVSQHECVESFGGDCEVCGCSGEDGGPTAPLTIWRLHNRDHSPLYGAPGFGAQSHALAYARAHCQTPASIYALETVAR